MYVRFLSTIVATAAAAMTLAANPASAVLSPSLNHNAGAPGKHCVVHLSSQGEVVCYGTFPEAIADATDGAITDAPLDASAAATDPAFKRRVEAAGNHNGSGTPGQLQSTVIEVAYSEADFQGSTHVVSARGGCDDDGGIEWSLDVMPPGWDNVISSFATYSACQANHWEHAGFGGSSTGWQDTTAWIGPAMNDQTSSIQWS